MKTATPLEQRLGYTFQYKYLLDEACRHISLGGHGNQRMEFLGDSLLNFCVTRLIFKYKLDWQEGAMSKLRGILVSTDSLLEWARELDIPLQVHGSLGKKRKPGIGPPLRKPVGDAVEALLAAIFLDQETSGGNGITTVMSLIEKRWGSFIQEAQPNFWRQTDSKTALQEWAASHGHPAPVYSLLEQTGPAHAPLFRVQVQVDLKIECAQGPSLKKAQVLAARSLLQRLESALQES